MHNGFHVRHTNLDPTIRLRYQVELVDGVQFMFYGFMLQRIPPAQTSLSVKAKAVSTQAFGIHLFWDANC